MALRAPRWAESCALGTGTTGPCPPPTPAPGPLSPLCSVDDGTLTRTMKPRRAAIMQKYAAQVAALEAHLR